ncbi:hypothetical protein [Amycolatopsis magusensis]|uniref:Uncharacterized protein n=1 Tax=Amycolatopsis magusensis TaxID=882444 RepID=A0ABS4Q6H0_9PSEU|nr:hypothetical protein [Amycolatopsis magusensis]MBP2186710.1 hypothetical protein [Amycolatopsis magusensis]
MSLPDYWLHRPVVPTTAALREQFDELLDGALAAGPDRPIDYRVDAPKWQFLCHAADRADFVLHGSGDPGITEFVPRRPPDLTDFGSRLAVFAAADGIWPMFYAILDRTGTPVSMCNGCVRVGEQARYHFSISSPALQRRPWRTGTVYLLPATTFESEPVTGEIRSAQAASPVPVRPVAKLTVHPEDFPFLHDVHGHHDAELLARAAADPDGFPWHEP